MSLLVKIRFTLPRALSNLKVIRNLSIAITFHIRTRRSNTSTGRAEIECRRELFNAAHMGLLGLSRRSSRQHSRWGRCRRRWRRFAAALLRRRRPSCLPFQLIYLTTCLSLLLFAEDIFDRLHRRFGVFFFLLRLGILIDRPFNRPFYLIDYRYWGVKLTFSNRHLWVVYWPSYSDK